MAEVNITIEGLEQLKAAVGRAPEIAREAVQTFLVSGMAEYRRGIMNNPWRLGMGGGGAPQATGTLARTHRTTIEPFEAKIEPTAKYAPYVHGLEGWTRKRSYQLRPWLTFVRQDKDSAIQRLEIEMLETIVNDLAR